MIFFTLTFKSNKTTYVNPLRIFRLFRQIKFLTLLFFSSEKKGISPFSKFIIDAFV